MLFAILQITILQSLRFGLLLFDNGFLVLPLRSKLLLIKGQSVAPTGAMCCPFEAKNEMSGCLTGDVGT